MPKVLIVPWIINKIRQAIGIVQDTDTATQAISKDSYVMWRGSLKKANSAISQNDTLSSTNLDDVPGGFGSVVKNLDDKIGTTTMGTIAATVTGAVKEVNDKIFANPSATTDFNTITTDGIYKFVWVSNGTTYNRPVNQGGQLITCEEPTSHVKTQIYSTSSGTFFVRGYHDNAWEDWKQMATMDLLGTTNMGTSATTITGGIKELHDQIASFNYVQDGNLTSLDNLPCPSMGRVAFNADINPIGTVYAFNFVVFGYNLRRSMIISAKTSNGNVSWIATRDDNGWSAWMRIASA